MGKLYNEYSKISNSYYKIPVNTDILFDDYNSISNCNNFINEHFWKGKKQGTLSITDDFYYKYESKGKQVHTVSLYLLGLCLKPLFNRILRWKIDNLIPSTDRWYHFEYTWYLTCLLHDIATVIEDDISFLLYYERVHKCQLFDEDKKLLRFGRDVVLNYLKYRYKDGKLDHGIYAASQICDNLKKSFVEETKGHNWAVEPIYIKNNLKWRLEHIRHFAYISDAICCHNIWLATSDNAKKLYRKNDLEKLCVVDNKDKLSLMEYPLQFVLCLLDTIEPIKRFTCLTPKEILESISIISGYDYITISWTNALEYQKQFNDWISPILTMYEWMQISIKECKCKNNEHKIKILIDEKR